MTFVNGVATFTLKDGEKKEATGLEAVITYEVKEKDYSKDGYVTTYIGETGTILEDITAVVTVINTKDTPPKTGESERLVCMAGILAVFGVMSMMIIMVIRKKQRAN